MRNPTSDNPLTDIAIPCKTERSVHAFGGFLPNPCYTATDLFRFRRGWFNQPRAKSFLTDTKLRHKKPSDKKELCVCHNI